jgi:steroid delta-isomerase-like uncharacterized protein
MAETASDLGRRWFEEVWNRGRREAIAEMLTAECLIHDGDVDSTGPDGFYPFFDRIRGTFSEMQVTVEDTIAQGDAACIRWSCSANHTRDGLGIPPTGKTIHVTGITILRAVGGKVVEAWQNWDMLGLMEQLTQGQTQGHEKKAATYIGAS